MGNPTVLYRKKQSALWRCKNCCNFKEFEEDWKIEINQDINHMSQEYQLVVSENIRCKICGSYEVEETDMSRN